MVEPSILHWLKRDLSSFEVIQQFSLFKQYKTGSPSSILEDLDKPNCLGSTYIGGTHEGVHNNDYNTQRFIQNIDLVYKLGISKYNITAEDFKTSLKVQHSQQKDNLTIQQNT